ncbi:MAG: VOC family protein [Archangiaceae bacterium]|nr:VOC family protein [Archangiaceae bacterium]
MAEPSGFVWHELVTPDPKAALKFYGEVIGWTVKEVPGGGGEPYRMLEANGRGVGGVFKAQGGMPTGWVGYLFSSDVDRDVKRLVASGAQLKRPPEDVPMAGRLAPMTDPQGAGFILFNPKPPPGQERQFATGQGSVAWNEYYASDLDPAVAFYREHFGFKPVRVTDMGDKGKYHVLDTTGTRGSIGMMKNPQPKAPPMWVFYFQVDDVDAAAKKVTAAGGKVLHGPMEVPTGDRVAMAFDPQGGMFALMQPKKG